MWAAASGLHGDHTGLGPAETSSGSVSFCRLDPPLHQQNRPTDYKVDSALQVPRLHFPHRPLMKSKHCWRLTEGEASRERALGGKCPGSSQHQSVPLDKSRSPAGPPPPHSSLPLPLPASPAATWAGGDCSWVCLIPHHLDFRSEWHVRAPNWGPTP